MSELVFNIVYELANILILLNFIFSKFFFRKINIEKKFLVFQAYLFFALFEVAFVDIVRLTSLSYYVNWFYPSIIFTTIHFALLSYFMFMEIKMKLRLYIVSFFLFLFLLVIMNVVDIKNETYYSATISNFGMILFSLFFYFDLIKNKHDDFIDKNPAIYIINGVFFGAGFLVPILIFGNHLREILDINTYNWIAILAPTGTIVMNLFFFKSILCIRQKTK